MARRRGNEGERGRYRLNLDGRACDVLAPFRGSYGAENCIAVAAVASLLGLTPETIARGLAGAEPPAQRFVRKQAGPWQIIDDTYNANPLSMARMLDAAAELAHGEGRGCFIAVLGEMRELGGLAVQEHERLGPSSGGDPPLCRVLERRTGGSRPRRTGAGRLYGAPVHAGGCRGIFARA